MKRRSTAFFMACLLPVCVWAQEVTTAWSLRQCIDYALEHNLQIKQKQVQQEEAGIQVNTAKMSRLPNLNAGVDQNWSFGRSNQTLTGIYEDQQNSSTGVGLSSAMPVFTGFRISNEIKQKELNLEAATHSLNKAKEDLSLSVASLYLQVLFNQELLKVREDQWNLSLQQVDKTQQLVEAGKVALSQLYDIKAQAAAQESNKTQAANNLQLSLLDLVQNLELTSLEGFTIQEPDTKVWMENSLGSLLPPDDIYRNALLFKSDVKEQESLLTGSRYGLKIAKAGYYPTLNLSLRYSNSYFYRYGEDNKAFSEQIKNNAGQSIGLSLSIPIFNRFQVRNQVRSARLNILNQELSLENTKKGLYKEIQTAYYNAVGAQQKYKSATQAEEAASQSFQYALDRYESGKMTVFELNEAQSKHTQSRSEQIQAKYDYLFRCKILDFYNGVEIRL